MQSSWDEKSLHGGTVANVIRRPAAEVGTVRHHKSDLTGPLGLAMAHADSRQCASRLPSLRPITPIDTVGSEKTSPLNLPLRE